MSSTVFVISLYGYFTNIEMILFFSRVAFFPPEGLDKMLILVEDFICLLNFKSSWYELCIDGRLKDSFFPSTSN